MTHEQAFGLMAAINANDMGLYRARWACIVYAPGRGNADRTVSRRRRAGSRRTKRHAGRTA